MKIYEIISQRRRDFVAKLVCEHCDNLQLLENGYDDDYFHQKVIPEIECKKCGKTSPETYIPNKTKYAPHEVV